MKSTKAGGTELHFNQFEENQAAQNSEVCIILGGKRKKKKFENIPAFTFVDTKLQCNKRSFFHQLVFVLLKTSKILVLW